MQRFCAFVTGAVATLLLLAGPSPMVRGAILNGSFESHETGIDGGAGREVFIVGTNGSGIHDWLLEGNGDVYLHITPAIGSAIGSTFNFAQDQNTYLDLSGGLGGGGNGIHATVSQTFATVPTAEYQLSFFIGAAFSPSSTINVQLNGASPLLNQTLTASGPDQNIVWTQKTFVFTADSSLTKLSFRDVSGGDDNVSFVDSVSVELVGNAAVPEPASMAIWSVGALGCALAGYRRRKLA